MFCIMFYLFLVSLTPVSSPGLNFVHCSFTVHRIFQECSPASGKRFYKVTWQSYEGKGGEMTNGKNLIIQVQQKLNAEYNLIFAATLLFKTWSVAPDTVFLFSRKKHFAELQIYVHVAFFFLKCTEMIFQVCPCRLFKHNIKL